MAFFVEIVIIGVVVEFVVLPSVVVVCFTTMFCLAC
jgi:hypothetical protein